MYLLRGQSEVAQHCFIELTFSHYFFFQMATMTTKMAAKTVRRSQLRPSTTMRRPRYSTGSPRCRARRRTTPRRTGQTTKPSCYSGPYRSTVGARASLRRSWTRMTGFRSQASFQAGMTRSASTSLIRTRSRQYRRAIGSRERMKS